MLSGVRTQSIDQPLTGEIAVGSRNEKQADSGAPFGLLFFLYEIGWTPLSISYASKGYFNVERSVASTLKFIRRLIVELVEPPSCCSSTVFIGKNSRGSWVAQEKNGLFGGLFVTRTAAVRYALFENGHHPEDIVPVTCVLELEIGRRSSAPSSALSGGEFPLQLVA